MSHYYVYYFSPCFFSECYIAANSYEDAVRRAKEVLGDDIVILRLAGVGG